MASETGGVATGYLICRLRRHCINTQVLLSQFLRYALVTHFFSKTSLATAMAVTALGQPA